MLKRWLLSLVILCSILPAFPTIAPATVNEVTAVNRYTGNGSTTVFAYTFKAFVKTDLEVLVNGTVKTVDTDYTVSGLGVSGGGSITFTTAPPSGQLVTILRKQPVNQGSVYTPNEAFPATRIEKDLDKQAMIDQQQTETIKRALKFAKDSTYVDVPFPNPDSGKYLRSTGSGVEWVDLATTGAPADIIAGDIKLVTDYASFAAAITAIGSTTTTLLIPSSSAVTDNVTVPANVTLWFAGSGDLNISNTKVVTINGPIQAVPSKQIFTGSGTVSGLSLVPMLYPDWWGTNASPGTTDMKAAIQAAITASSDGHVIHFLPTHYHLASGVTVAKRLRLQGTYAYGDSTPDVDGSIISGTGFTLLTMQEPFTIDHLVIYDPTGNASTIGIDINDGATGVAKWAIQDSFIIAPTATFGTVGTGIRGIFALEGVIQNTTIEGWLNGIDWQASGGAKSNANDIRGSKIRQNTIGLLVTSADNALVSGSTIEGNSTGIKALAGRVTVTQTHFENNLGDKRQVHMNGGQIISIGNGYYVTPTTDLDIYIQSGSAAHMSIGDTLNAGVKHSGTGLFNLYSPLLTPIVSGTGPIARVDGTGVTGLQGLSSTSAAFNGFSWLNIDSHLAMTEISNPSGTANTGRLFVRDNGSGKSQLAVIFGTGAVQVLATEP